MGIRLVRFFLSRETNDPMVKLLNDYEMSLLKPPSDDESVGDLLIHYAGKTSTQGRITYLLDPPLELPPLKRNKHLPDFSGSMLSNISFNQGFSWLEGFFNVLKVGGLCGRLKLLYEREHAAQISFRFSDVTQDSVDVIDMGSRLETPNFRVKNPFYDGKSQYYLSG